MSISTRRVVAALFACCLVPLADFAAPPAVEKPAEKSAAAEANKEAKKKKDESIPPAPPRAAGEGEGPYDRLILRGATLIDGTGSPPVGPVDIVIEKNRIADVQIVGS